MAKIIDSSHKQRKRGDFMEKGRRLGGAAVDASPLGRSKRPGRWRFSLAEVQAWWVVWQMRAHPPCNC